MAKRMKKYETLSEWLLEDLARGGWKTGQRFYSENQLCNKYSMSRQTVRQALAVLIDAGFLEAIKGSGTYVTQHAIQSTRRQTHNIGIIVTYLSDYIFPIIIREIEAEFSRNGYSVTLASTGNSVVNERRLLRGMLEKQVDGIILEPTKSALPNPNMDIFRSIQDIHLPLVCINSTYPELDVPVVGLDDVRAGCLAAEHLLQRGHRRIGWVLKSDDLQGHRRYEGMQQAMIDAGVDANDQHSFWYTTEDLPELQEDAEHILRRLDGCTAVLCYNDQIAVTLLQILRDAGLEVPRDLSVVSIDDSRYANMAATPLSSVHNPVTDLGRIAARLMLRQIGGYEVRRVNLLEPRLRIRQSVSDWRNGLTAGEEEAARRLAVAGEDEFIVHPATSVAGAAEMAATEAKLRGGGLREAGRRSAAGRN